MKIAWLRVIEDMKNSVETICKNILKALRKPNLCLHKNDLKREWLARVNNVIAYDIGEF